MKIRLPTHRPAPNLPNVTPVNEAEALQPARFTHNGTAKWFLRGTQKGCFVQDAIFSRHLVVTDRGQQNRPNDYP